jgi:electron transport complex protein RnfG
MTSTRQMIMTLCIVALTCAIVLSFVYAFTSPRITETQKNLMLDGLKEVSQAFEFVEIIPDTLWRALDSLKKSTGIVFRVFPQGYGGSIPITVGLDTDGKITGVRIASAAEGLKETPGLGAKITEPDFTQQFIGKCAPEVQLKNGGGEIDAITAATISSRAVTAGIRRGIEIYAHYLGEVYDKRNVFPAAENFREIIHDTLWYAVGESDTIGIVFFGVTQGYLDCIKFIAGVDNKEKITGVEIVYSNETEGIGEAIRDQKFLNTFKEGAAEAITGATISSQALIDAVQENLQRFKGYLK